MEEKTINYEIEKYHRNVSDELLLEDMRRTTRKLLKDTLINKEYETGRHLFANNDIPAFWRLELRTKKAGLQITRPRCISDAELFDNLKTCGIHLAGSQRIRN
jgi:hypothetical protein